MNVYLYACDACHTLRGAKDFAAEFVRLRMEFFRTFQNGLVFSTRFGADFFDEIKVALETGKKIPHDQSGILGDYDKNFNRWLDEVRQK